MKNFFNSWMVIFILTFHITILLFIVRGFSQSTPSPSPYIYPDIIFENINNVGNATNYLSYTGIISPSTINNPVYCSQNAQVNFQAGTHIILKPGFYAGSFSATGYANFFIHQQPINIVVYNPNPYQGDVPEFDKFELGLKLPEDINTQINLFLGTYPNYNRDIGINPYDPDKIDVYAILKAPSGKIKRINAFFYRPYKINQAGNGWEEDTKTDFPFRLRIAPDEIGSWIITDIFIKAYQYGTFHDINLPFNCISNPVNKGFLEKGISNRFLRFSGTYEPFFVIGEDQQWVHLWAQNLEFDKYQLHKKWMNDLSEYNGNFISLALLPQEFGCEWENLGIYDKYVPAGDRQKNAWVFDDLLENARTKNLFIKLQFLLHDFARSWDKNPNPYRQFGDSLSFFTNQNSIMYFKKYLRYTIARYGYSTNIAYYDVADELDGFLLDVYSDGPSITRTALISWSHEILNYLKDTLHDPHLMSYGFAMTCKYQQPSNNNYPRNVDLLDSVFNYSKCDILQSHMYSVNKSGNWERAHKFATYLQNYQNYHPAKPYLFAEMGSGVDKYESCIHYTTEQSPDFKGLMLHNDIWATSFMGGLGSGLDFFCEFSTHSTYDLYTCQDHENQYYKHFRPLYSFIYGRIMPNINIDEELFSPDYYKQQMPYPLDSNDYKIESFWLKSDAKNYAFGWLHNATYYYGNLPFEQKWDPNCPGSAYTHDCHDIRYIPQDDDSYTTPVPIDNEDLIIQKLLPMTVYIINYYSINTDSVTPLVSDFQATDTSGKVIFPLTNIFPANAYDLAFQLNIFGYNSFFGHESMIFSCPEVRIPFNDTYKNDSSGQYKYNWDFGNGIRSSSPHPLITYKTPGTYQLALRIIDNDKVIKSYKQTIIINSCQKEGEKTVLTSIPITSTISNDEFVLSPNPTNGNINLEIPTEFLNESIRIDVITSTGNSIKSVLTFNSLNAEIDLTSVPAGIYFLRIYMDNQEPRMKKVVKY